MYDWKYVIKFKLESGGSRLMNCCEILGRGCAKQDLGKEPGNLFGTCILYDNMPPDVFFKRFKNIVCDDVDEIHVFRTDVDNVIANLKSQIEKKTSVINDLNEELSRNISNNLVDIQQRERRVKCDIL